MKIALYEIADNVERYQYLEETTEDREKDETYIRISDIHDIDFKMVDDSTIIPLKVKALRVGKTLMMKDIDDKIAKLQAITHNPIPKED